MKYVNIYIKQHKVNECTASAIEEHALIYAYPSVFKKCTVVYRWYWDKDNESRKESWESLLDIHLTDQMALISLDGSVSVLLLLVLINTRGISSGVCVGERKYTS